MALFSADFAHPCESASPLLITVPHASRTYPDALLTLARLDPVALRPLEDRYADLLPRMVESQGHQVLESPVARAWIDLNRAENELDHAALGAGRDGLRLNESPKARGGLGLIPTRLHGTGSIWRAPLSLEDIEERIERYHRPWHIYVAQQLSARHARFGQAVLIDLHSMPPVRSWRHNGPPPAIVLGDAFGRSAARDLVEALSAEVCATGLSVARNHPYAGGYTLERHGKPAHGIHSIQIEVDRSLYLDSAFDAPGPGLATVQALIARIAERALAWLDRPQLLAAE